MNSILNDIIVTDLFGYNISNISSFIIINSLELHKILKLLKRNNKTSIWAHNKDEINKILKMHNVDPNLFCPLGHYYYDSSHNIKTIILANKSICKKPTQFQTVSKYSDGTILNPIDESGNFISLGMVWINNTSSTLPKIYLIPTDFVKINKLNKLKFKANEYYLLSNSEIGIKSIKKSKLCNNNITDMKIINASDNIDLINNDINNSKKKSNQLVSYSAQGELILNDKCISNDEFKKNKENWNISNNITKYDEESDLDSYLSNIQSDNKKNKIPDTNFSWSNFSGKNVVLVESNDPWYINKTNTIEHQFIKGQNIDNNLKYRNHADFKSNKILDLKSPSLGYGNSYIDRLTNSIKIEGFNAQKNDNINIIASLLCVLILLFLYKCVKHR